MFMVYIMHLRNAGFGHFFVSSMDVGYVLQDALDLDGVDGSIFELSYAEG